jgi:hypothetical protein
MRTASPRTCSGHFCIRSTSSARSSCCAKGPLGGERSRRLGQCRASAPAARTTTSRPMILDHFTDDAKVGERVLRVSRDGQTHQPIAVNRFTNKQLAREHPSAPQRTRSRRSPHVTLFAHVRPKTPPSTLRDAALQQDGRPENCSSPQP